MDSKLSKKSEFKGIVIDKYRCTFFAISQSVPPVFSTGSVWLTPTSIGDSQVQVYHGGIICYMVDGGLDTSGLPVGILARFVSAAYADCSVRASFFTAIS